MTARLVLLFALLWYALVPSIARSRAGEGPSLRAHRIAIAHVVGVVRTAPREAARAQEADAPALPAKDAAPVVGPASFGHEPAPNRASHADPDALAFVPVARGPPTG